MSLHPLFRLTQSLLVCLAGELVKQLVASVKDENNRDNQLEEPQATAPSSTRSFPRPSTSWSSPSSSSSSSAPRSLSAKLASTTWACQPSLRRSEGASSSELWQVLDARAEPSARVLVSHFRENVYVSMCGPLGVVSCARVVGPSGPKDVPVTIYMSCMMVWCVWNHSQRTRTRGIVDEDQGNL